MNRAPQTKKYYFFLCALLALPILATLPLDVIDIDSSQYAEISREMVKDHSFFRLVDNGRRYLDKPILTFWTIASSFYFFGVNNIGFRIPALLLSFLSIISLYHTSLLIWGNSRKAIFTCIFYIMAPGFYAMLVDPKIDVYLVAYLIFSFHFYYLGKKKNPNFYYLMYLAMSLGFITKGPISAVIPGIAIGGDILIRRDWKLLASMKIPTGLIVLLSFPAFWCYLLFQEFQTYGPAFFIWIQSFGRFYKEMYNIQFDPFYFYKSFGWAFGTAIIPFVLYVFLKLKDFFLKKEKESWFKRFNTEEFLTTDFVIPFWVFLFLFLISFSRYPLPQYVYWVLPGASLFFGNVLDSILSDSKRQWLLNGLYPVALVYLVGYLILPFESGLIQIDYFIALGITILLFLIFFNRIPSPILAISLSYFLLFGSISLLYYPFLTSYQPSKQIGAKVLELEPNQTELYTYRIPHSKRSYSFYANRYTRSIYETSKIKKVWAKENERLVLLPTIAKDEFLKLAGKNYELTTVLELDSYKVATPTAAFVKKDTRKSQVQRISLIWLKKRKGK